MPKEIVAVLVIFIGVNAEISRLHASFGVNRA